MKIITYTIFAIIAVLASSLRRNKAKRNPTNENCTAVCGKGHVGQLYNNKSKGGKTCVCRKDGEITEAHQWEDNKYGLSKRGPSYIKNYIATGILVAA